jgi:outer membrane lipoprotein SlyB
MRVCARTASDAASGATASLAWEDSAMTHRFGYLVVVACIATASVAAAQSQPPPPRVCGDCGVVASVRQVQQQGQSSGVGMVAGGVLGGVLGHQIGSGRGNTVATIAGAGVGAVAGNEIEKSHKTKTSWTVSIRMDAGNTRTLTYSNQPAVREGDRVKLVNGGRQLALIAN